MAADEANMYAVIRGDKKSGLAVTLYGNEIMLAPDPNISIRGPANSQLKSASTDTRLSYKPSINTATQAVDGRYASVYQATIGQMRPTNPPDVLTEFPPQRTETCRGGGNFVVGGPGSGDTTYRHVCCSNVYRGGLMWPDKESVCSPRPSIQPDAFVNSLRKYPPRLSPDRSTEIVERLVNYTQAKNFGRSRSPSQQVSHNYYENPEMSAPKSPNKISRGCDAFSVYDESPTRESANQADPVPDAKRNFYFKSCDVRNIREASKAIRENMSTNATCGSSLNNQPMRFLRQPFPPNTRRSAPPPPEPTYPSMVHSEIQAAVTMVCREVETVPTVHASKQDIKFTRSNVEQAVQVEIAAPQNQTQSISSDLELPSSNTVVLAARASKSTEHIDTATIDFPLKVSAEVQNKLILTHVHYLQSVFSAKDVTKESNVAPNNLCKTQELSESHDNRKTKKDCSEDVIRECFNELQLVQKGKKWSIKLEKLAEKLKKPGGEDKLKHKIKKYLKHFPSHFDTDDEEGQRFREQLPDYIVNKLKKTFIKQRSSFSCSPVPVEFSALKREKHQANLKTIVKAWIKMLPLKKRDFLGRPIKREDISENITAKLDPFISYRPKSDTDFGNMLTSYVTDLASAMPLSYDLNKEKEYMTSIVDELVENILIFEKQGTVKRSSKVKKCGSFQNGFNDSEGLREELEHFITCELKFILQESDVTVRKNVIKFIEREILYILWGAIQSPRSYKSKVTKLNVCNLLKEICNLPDLQATYFSEELVSNFKILFLNNLLYNSRQRYRGAYSEACLVYYVPHIKFTSPALKNEIVDTNMKEYAKQISSCIDNWLCIYRMYLPLVQHQTFRNSAINELTDAIIHRHLYLKRKKSNRFKAYDEKEHIKYLISKWIRKLFGEDNKEITQHVPELIQNLENIKMLKPDLNIQYSKSYTVVSKHQMELVNYLYEEILVWYSNLPQCLYTVNDKKMKRNNMKQLAIDIAKGLEDKVKIDELLAIKVDSWTKNLLKMLPTCPLIEDLKARLKLIILEIRKTKIDSSLQTDEIAKYSFCSDLNCNEIAVDLIWKVINEIHQWLSGMHLPIRCSATATEAIKNLALDIIDRYKYLELNANASSTNYDELENLKYQVYKWLNSVVYENYMKLVEHAPELMQRLHSVIPNTENMVHIDNAKNERQYNNLPQYPNSNMSAKEKKCGKYSSTKIITTNILNLEENEHNDSTRTELEPITLQFFTRAAEGRDSSADRQERIGASRKTVPSHATDFSNNYTTTQKSYCPSPMQWVSNPYYPCYAPDYSAFAFNSYERPGTVKINHDNILTKNSVTETHTNSKKLRIVETIHQSDLKPSKITPNWRSSLVNESTVNSKLSLAYEYFDNIFKKRCEDLPVNDSRHKASGENIKKRITSTIWKTFFKIKEDPSIQNNEELLVDIIEDQLDDLLVDYFPQTTQLIKEKQKWKNSLLRDVSIMIYCVHEIITSFRQQLAEKFKTNFFKLHSNELCDQMRDLFTMKIVDAFIMYVIKLETRDSVKVNVYKEHVMKNVLELFDSSKEQQDLNMFCDNALRILESVPIPDNEKLKNEADEILMGYAIEQWYNDLPSTRNQWDILKFRTKETLLTLAKIDKICKKNNIIDTGGEHEMLRVITEYLTNCGWLASIQDLNLKAKELVNILNYQIFDDNMILSDLPVNDVLEGTRISQLEVNTSHLKSDSVCDQSNDYREYTDTKKISLLPGKHQSFFVDEDMLSVPVKINYNMANSGRFWQAQDGMNPNKSGSKGSAYRPSSFKESVEFERSGSTFVESHTCTSSTMIGGHQLDIY